jgi:hypothetical protein
MNCRQPRDLSLADRVSRRVLLAECRERDPGNASAFSLESDIPAFALTVKVRGWAAGAAFARE